MLSFGLSSLRLLAYLSITLVCIPIQVAALRMKLDFAKRFPRLYHRQVCRILGLRVSVEGTLAKKTPVLFVVNHASYLDIEVLGGYLPGSFVAKSEVRSWPLFGFLATLQHTVFVDRQVRTSSQQRDSLSERLQAGGNLILFPEGTSNDGMHVQPFKSSLFSVAEQKLDGDGRVVTVQPVTLAYTAINGLPMRHARRPEIAWYGDMALANHLWHVASLGSVEARIVLHPSVDVAMFGGRKRLAEHCFQQIRSTLALANAGRLDAEAPDRIPAETGALHAPADAVARPVAPAAVDAAALPAQMLSQPPSQ